MYTVTDMLGTEWQVRDEKGVIHSGPEGEMRYAFEETLRDDPNSDYYCEDVFPPIELVQVVLRAE